MVFGYFRVSLAYVTIFQRNTPIEPPPAGGADVSSFDLTIIYYGGAFLDDIISQKFQENFVLHVSTLD